MVVYVDVLNDDSVKGEEVENSSKLVVVVARDVEFR